jgi:hypothetical protein
MPEQLEHLRNFASSARRGGFGVPFFKLDGNTGEFRRTGKNNTDPMNHQKLACDPVDAMTGWQKFEKKIPVYQIGRVSSGFVPPPREELGDLDESHWEKGKDPWVRVDLLPFWNPESREVLLFSAANTGSRDAVAYLVEAYVNNIGVHPEDLSKVPLIELEIDSYTNSHGKQIFIPIFAIIDWIERPAAVRRIAPPPVRMLELTALLPAVPATPPTPAKTDQRAPAAAKAKPKPKNPDEASKPVSFDMDDEIPF